mgnify:CR=1 FL=1
MEVLTNNSFKFTIGQLYSVELNLLLFGVIFATIWTELELFHILTYHQEVLDWMMIRDSALLGSKFWRVLYLKIRRS